MKRNYFEIVFSVFLILSIIPSFSQEKNKFKTIFKSSDAKIINLSSINHEGVDYAPTVSGDGKTLLFVSNRDGSKVDNDNWNSHDFWVVYKEKSRDRTFSIPENIEKSSAFGKNSLNTEMSEGAGSITGDGQAFYFTGCNRSGGLGKCDIYMTNKNGDKWTRALNLGRKINSKDWDSQPSITHDQSRIYFTSNRNGENIDLWYSDWDSELGDWKEPVNLESINTPGKDWSPFIAADNVTLFFASDGHEPSHGGMDFYVTVYDPESDTWSKPENLGKPINTSGDESFITITADGNVVYFSSTREDIDGYQGSLDLFMMYIPTK